MITITTEPEFCLPGCPTRIIIAGAAQDTQRVFVKAAPPGSSFYRNDGTEVPLQSTKDAPERIGLETTIFDADVSGKYTLVIEDVDSVPDRTPTYDQSPNHLHTEAIVSRTEVSLYVSEKLTLDIQAAGTSCTLLMYLNNATVHETRAEIYGPGIGASPRLEKPNGLKAKNAAQAVAPSDLIGQTATQLLGDLPELADELAAKLAAHADRTVGGIHVLDDLPVVRMAQDAAGFPATSKGLVDQLNLVNAAFLQHIRNATDGYQAHEVSDKRNVPIVGGCGDERSALLLIADLYRCMQGHFVQVAEPASHGDDDTLAAIGTPGSLIVFLADYFEALAQVTPTPASTANPGAAYLQAMGFVSAVPGEVQVT